MNAPAPTRLPPAYASVISRRCTPVIDITALATAPQHPRSVSALPNGDVLLVESVSPDYEPITHPKTIVMHYVESWVTSAGQPQHTNRITLLREGQRVSRLSAQFSSKI